MDAGQYVFLGLRINNRALFDHASEGRLDMTAGATEAVVQVHVAEGRVQIVLE